MKRLFYSIYLRIRHVVYSIEQDPNHPFKHYKWWMDNWYNRVLDSLVGGEE